MRGCEERTKAREDTPHLFCHRCSRHRAEVEKLTDALARRQASPLHSRDLGRERPRVLRLMRQRCLLAPYRRRHARGDRAHAGTIITARPNELWGTDATRFWAVGN